MEQTVGLEAGSYGTDPGLLWQPFSDGSETLPLRLARDEIAVSIYQFSFNLLLHFEEFSFLFAGADR